MDAELTGLIAGFTVIAGGVTDPEPWIGNGQAVSPALGDRSPDLLRFNGVDGALCTISEIKGKNLENL